MCGISAILRSRRRRQTEKGSTAPTITYNESARRQVLALAKRGPTVIGVTHITFGTDDGASSSADNKTTTSSFSIASPLAIRELIAYDPEETHKPIPAVLKEVVAATGVNSAAAGTPTHSSASSMTLIGAVLHLRGEGKPLEQPFTANHPVADDDTSPSAGSSSYLCWNGEVFGGSADIKPEQCDTVIVFEALRKIENTIRTEVKNSGADHAIAPPAASSASTAAQLFTNAVRDLFESHLFEGPCAYIYFAASLDVLVFGRDVVGRRSLVIKRSRQGANGEGEDEEIVISSVAATEAEAAAYNTSAPSTTDVTIAIEGIQEDTAPSATPADAVTSAASVVVTSPALAWLPALGEWAEVPTTGVFAIGNVRGDTATEGYMFYTASWTYDNRRHPLLTHIPRVAEPLSTNPRHKGSSAMKVAEDVTAAVVAATDNATVRAAAADAQDTATVAPTKASMWRFALPNNKVFPSFPFPLRQLVAMQDELAATQLAEQKAKKNESDVATNTSVGGFATAEKRQMIIDALTRFPMGVVDFSQQVVRMARYKHNSTTDCPFPAAQLYLTALLDSVSRRVDVSTRRGNGGHSVMVMLSGGIDSTVLAALTHYCLPTSVPIEVVNVAFVDRCNDVESSLTPDRIASYQAFAELMALPGADKRRWRFVEVNVCPMRLTRHKRRILSLVSPRSTVMDHDIGCALWFASQGVGLEVPCEDVLYRAEYFGGAAGGQSIGNKLVRRAGDSASASTLAAAPCNGAGQKRCRSPPTAATDGKAADEAAAVDVTTKPVESPEERVRRFYGPLIDILQNEGFEPTAPNSNNPSISCTKPPMMGGMSSYDYCRGDTHHLLQNANQHFSGRMAGDSDSDADDVANHKSKVSKNLIPKKVMLATLGKEYGAVLTPLWKDVLGYKKLGFYLNDAAKDGVINCGNRGTTSQYVQLAREVDITAAAGTIAARAEVCSSPDAVPYTCQSPIVIMGMGADETLGGYVRHERLAAQYGWAGLQRELQCDFDRLWERNLGRDDRIISDSGREARFPFLDERVLYAITVLGAACPTAVCEFAGAVPPSTDGGSDSTPYVHGPTGPCVGDKKILRTVARMIGLDKVSTLQKRAVQFGSRIADPKQRGSAALD